MNNIIGVHPSSDVFRTLPMLGSALRAKIKKSLVCAVRLALVQPRLSEKWLGVEACSETYNITGENVEMHYTFNSNPCIMDAF